MLAQGCRSPDLPVKREIGWAFPILKSDDSYHPSHSQQGRKWNTAQLLLGASYQIQTQTGTVWLRCACDLSTYFTRKLQVTSELWRRPAGSQHASGTNIVHQEHWAQIIHRSDSGSPRQDPGKILENTVLTWKLQFLVFHGRWVLTEALIMVPGTCILGSPCHWILGYQTVLESRLTFSLY